MGIQCLYQVNDINRIEMKFKINIITQMIWVCTTIIRLLTMRVIIQYMMWHHIIYIKMFLMLIGGSHDIKTIFI